VPLVALILGQNLNTSVFVLGGSIGYFVLGTYLQKVKLRSSLLYALLILGFSWTVVTTWFMNFPFRPVGQQYFFLDYLTANVIIISVTLFMLLSKFPADWPGSNHPRGSRLIHAIGCNTLPIYLFHVIILESLQIGFFGFKLSMTMTNPIVGVPLIIAVTFVITFGWFLP